MADGAELVKMRLTFWHKGKVPGDIVEVRRDELHQWRGFAVPVQDEPAKTVDDASVKAPTKTSTTKQA
jgi:hypothetical protein